MKNTERANAIANSVKEMLNDTFNIINDTKAVSNNMIHVRVVESHAEYVQKLMEVNYCESLVLIAVSNADEVTTLVYIC